VNYLPWFTQHDYKTPAVWFRNFCIWVTLAVTVWSGLTYVTKSIALALGNDAKPAPEPKPPTSLSNPVGTSVRP